MHYRVGLSICRKVLQTILWEVPPAERPYSRYLLPRQALATHPEKRNKTLRQTERIVLYMCFVWDLGQVMDRQEGRLRLLLKERERKKGGSWQKKKLEQRNSSLSLWSLSLSLLFVPLTHSLYELTPRERETDSHIHRNFGVGNIISM